MPLKEEETEWRRIRVGQESGTGVRQGVHSNISPDVHSKEPVVKYRVQTATTGRNLS